MNKLTKKLFRDMRRNKMQFITIFLMVFLGVFVYAGIHAYMDGMQKSSDVYYENNNLQDIWISGKNFSDEDLEKVKSLPNIKDAERQLTINTLYKEKELDLQTNFIESNNISKFYVIDGEGFDKEKSGVWVDYYFAKNNDLKVGDEITLRYENTDLKEKVLGLIETPDHVYATKDETEVFPDHSKFGYVYLSINEFPMDYHIFTAIIVDIDDTNKLEETKADIENNISSALAVTDRESSASYKSYQSEIEEGDTYSGVFTALFLIIAVLSVVTTMNRFVKKQRTQIGTLKALGFKKRKIVTHYINYGFYVSVVAAVLGIFAGAYSLGLFFLGREMERYEMPEYSIIIAPKTYLLAAGVVALITFITYLSCRSILKEPASEALRVQMPKVKKARFNLTSKGVLKNASVSTKWNLRDIVRNKARSITAVVGVVGCTMLLVCAFGMLDSMNSYLDWEFNKICNFDYKITLKEDCTEEQFNNLISKYGDNTSQTLGIEIKNGDKKETNIITVNNALDYLKYTNHKREYMDISSDGVYITEKLADTLKLKVNDEIEWHIFGDNTWYKTKIVGLNRDPQSQSLNMTKEYYESLGLEYKPDCIYTNENLENVKELDGVKAVQNIKEMKTGMENMLATMKALIVIMVVVAGALGMVIIYNLGILSLSEKHYQFATLKVLGFKDKQIKNIFIKQNIWLTVIGVVLGLPLGFYMTDFIFKMAMSQDYDFGASIKIWSYLYAVVGILVVSFIVNKRLAKKIGTIDMVSSLKANE
jgi:putative ABC transport system permease protein